MACVLLYNMVYTSMTTEHSHKNCECESPARTSARGKSCRIIRSSEVALVECTVLPVVLLERHADDRVEEAAAVEEHQTSESFSRLPTKPSGSAHRAIHNRNASDSQ